MSRLGVKSDGSVMSALLRLCPWKPTLSASGGMSQVPTPEVTRSVSNAVRSGGSVFTP
jgi:hypothetical protein